MFQQGNKYATGGKRANAGRKKKSVVEMEQERQQTAREIYRAEQQRQAKAVIDTYYRLAKSGRYPAATLHEIDKIDPDDKVNAPTLVINFVAFNPGSHTSNHIDDVTSGNNSAPIDITPSHAPIVAPIVSSPPPLLAPSASTLPQGLTFTDIKRSK